MMDRTIFKRCPGPENAQCSGNALIGPAAKRCPACSHDQARIRHARHQREARAAERAAHPLERPLCPGTDLAPCRGFHRCTARGKRCGDCQTMQKKLRDKRSEMRAFKRPAKSLERLKSERPRMARLLELARAAGLKPMERAA